MAVHVTDHSEEIKNATKVKSSIFLRLMMESIEKIAQPNTPKDKGNLGNDILKNVTGVRGRMEWRKDYAQYQERGMRKDGTRRVKHYTTPGTGPHYAENAVMAGIDKTNVVARSAGLVT